MENNEDKDTETFSVTYSRPAMEPLSKSGLSADRVQHNHYDLSFFSNDTSQFLILFQVQKGAQNGMRVSES
jgi:hypothetical protein